MVEIPSEFHNSEEQISTPTSPSPQTSALIDEPMLEESSPIPDDPNITDNSPMPEESEENLLNETIEADEPLSPGAEAALLEEFSQPPPTAPAELDIMNILDNLNSELTQQKRKEDEQLTIDSLLNDMDGNVPSTSE